MAFQSRHPLSSSYNVLGGDERSDLERDISLEDLASPSIGHDRQSQIYASIARTETRGNPIYAGPQKRSCLQALDDWWAWEIAGIILSLLCLSATIGILARLDNQPFSVWNFPITPNALIAIFTTLSKVSLITSVASCVGQLKWSYFQDRTRQLLHLQHFEDASRGPWGSLAFLWNVGREAPLAGIGAVLTVLALAIEPFSQQVVGFESRYSALANVSAGISRVQFYNSGWSDVNTFNPAMVAAILDGAYSLNQLPEVNCPTGTCDFPTFTSIGMCSSCMNVTATANVSCTYPDGAMSSCLFQTTSGVNISLVADVDDTPSWTNGTPITRTAYAYAHILLEPSENNVPVAGIKYPLAAFAGVKFKGYPVYLLPTPMTAYEVTECAFYVCEKTYENAKVINGVITADPTPAKDRQLYLTPWFSQHTLDSYNYLSLDPADNWVTNIDSSSTDGDPVAPPGRTFAYGVYGIEYINLNSGLTHIFNLTGTDDPTLSYRAFNFLATPLWSANDLSVLIANVTTSMTNSMRASPNSNVVAGTAFGMQAYVHVRWPWLVLPAGAVLMGVLFLGATVVWSRKRGTLLWKSSSLAILLHGVKLESDAGNGSVFQDHWDRLVTQRHLSQMEILARGYAVRFDAGALHGEFPAPGNGESGEEELLERVPGFVVRQR